jgi:hypothetical protein
MVTRRTTWAGYGITGVILLAGGFWGGKSLSTDTATPDARAGTVRLVSITGDAFAIQLSGTQGTTSYAMANTMRWRDKYGVWWDGTQPACMKPLSHGQHITIGVINAEPAGDAPGGPVVVWIECTRSPAPRFPIVTPGVSGSP